MNDTTCAPPVPSAQTFREARARALGTGGAQVVSFTVGTGGTVTWLSQVDAAKRSWSLVYGGGTMGLMGVLAGNVVASQGSDAVHGIILKIIAM
ncbi:MAG: hypothetical protein EOO68_33415 [Moraxellaceae bacterium]|nr:MAG: hypothetical protein EOO68_33415 [Moraxellaceae bacterium]